MTTLNLKSLTLKALTPRSLSQFTAGLALGLVPALLPMLMPAGPAWGHGAKLNYNLAPSVQVQAEYDNGEPMAEAQVAVFAPDQPEQPWQTGLTDSTGRFSFSPDGAQPGRWEVQVRQAGHGGVIAIPLGGDGAGAVLAESASINGASANSASANSASAGVPQAGGTGYSPAQIGLMIALGLWGCLGTGLFFARRSGPSASGPSASGSDQTDASATAALANPHAHS